MPIFEYGCHACGEISELLIRGGKSTPASISCEHCGRENAIKLVSRVNYIVAKKAKYNDEFLGKAMPAFKNKKETGQYFTEGKGSDESKMFEMSEHIGNRIDRVLQTHFPK